MYYRYLYFGLGEHVGGSGFWLGLLSLFDVDVVRIILLEFVVYLVEIFYVVCCFEIILSYVKGRG